MKLDYLHYQFPFDLPSVTKLLWVAPTAEPLGTVVPGRFSQPNEGNFEGNFNSRWGRGRIIHESKAPKQPHGSTVNVNQLLSLQSCSCCLSS